MARMIDKVDIDILERNYTFEAQGQLHTVTLSPWHIAEIEAYAVADDKDWSNDEQSMEDLP